MGDMIFLIGGYAVFIIVMLLYIYSLVHRQKNLQKEVATLKQLAESESSQNTN